MKHLCSGWLVIPRLMQVYGKKKSHVKIFSTQVCLVPRLRIFVDIHIPHMSAYRGA
jgi:hypothetical protein